MVIRDTYHTVTKDTDHTRDTDLTVTLDTGTRDTANTGIPERITDINNTIFTSEAAVLKRPECWRQS